jgi:hypothetical protein
MPSRPPQVHGQREHLDTHKTSLFITAAAASAPTTSLGRTVAAWIARKDHKFRPSNAQPKLYLGCLLGVTIDAKKSPCPNRCRSRGGGGGRGSWTLSSELLGQARPPPPPFTVRSWRVPSLEGGRRTRQRRWWDRSAIQLIISVPRFGGRDTTVTTGGCFVDLITSNCKGLGSAMTFTT